MNDCDKQLISRSEKIEEDRIIPLVSSWAVAWTKSRAEKALVEYLLNRCVACYLPLVNKRRVYGRHIRISKVPLFPGYVFYDNKSICRADIFRTKKVVKILTTDAQERLDTELRNIAIAISRSPIFHEAKFNVKGTPVRVVKGPLANLEGEFVKRKNNNYVVLKVTILSRAIEIEVDEAFLRFN
jgi:transcription antitermination factor NusG